MCMYFHDVSFLIANCSMLTTHMPVALLPKAEALFSHNKHIVHVPYNEGYKVLESKNFVIQNVKSWDYIYTFGVLK